MSPIEPGAEIVARFTALAASGAAHGAPADNESSGISIFAHGVAPDETARVRIVERKGRYANAGLVEILEPSSLRVDPPCPVFGICGGCDWQHVSYDAQLLAKREIVQYAAMRAGVGIDVEACVPSPAPYFWRGRAEFRVGAANGSARVGFFRRDSHDLVPIDACPQLISPLNDALSAIRDAASAAGFGVGETRKVRAVADGRSNRVFIKVLGRAQGEADRDLVFEGGQLRDAPRTLEFSYAAHGVEYAFDPRVFTQVNAGVNERLIEHVAGALGARPTDTLLELFAGMGNFTFAIAPMAARVIAVESDPIACASSKRAAREYGNVEMVCANAAGHVRRIDEARMGIDLVLVDPPRAGLGAKLARRIGALRPRRLAYVSCNPETLMSDAKVLHGEGLRLLRATPFDMFPQTRHVECVGVFAY